MGKKVLRDNSISELLKTDPGRIYGNAIIAQVPRLLGQIDRNPHSPTYGSCCRNFWHYRIEDISNSQMQEVVLALAFTYQVSADWNPYAHSPQLLTWIKAVLRFWTTLQRPSGSFDEVYRGQDSYAATAFSCYCASEAGIILQSLFGAELLASVNETLDHAVDWLDRTDERLACNQLAGAAAAMFNVYILTGEEKSKQAAKRLVAKLKQLQNDEGWFNEYGGADIGYSSLTLDYLCKLWVRSGWDDALQMALRLLEFLSYFIHQDGTAGGVHGSRNTEYVIPHGVELLSPHFPLARSVSNLLLSSLIERPERSVISRLDDRYLCYLSGFFMQAAEAAVPRTDLSIDLPYMREHQCYFPRAGMWSVANERYHLVVNVAKGGVLRCDFHDGNSFQDSGLFVTQLGGDSYTTQTLQSPAEAEINDMEAVVAAPLVKLRHITVSPWRMLVFKTYNLLVPSLLRKFVLGVIRRLAVGSGRMLSHVHRTIRAELDSVYVHDKLALPVGSFVVRIALATERAFSFASCGFFHPAELEQETSRPVQKHLEGPCEVQLSRTVNTSGWHHLEKVCTQDRVDEEMTYL